MDDWKQMIISQTGVADSEACANERMKHWIHLRLPTFAW